MTAEEQSREYDRRFNSRIDRLEGIVEGLATNQARVETTLQGLTSQMGSIADSLDQMNRESVQQSKTNWTMIWTAGTLVVALVVALGTGFVGKPLSNLETKVESHMLRSDETVSGVRHMVGNIQQENVQHHARSDVIHEQTTSDLSYLKNLMHRDEEKMALIRDKATNQEARIQNLERLMFPDAKYRAGTPD
jgi:hypothetical protein